MEQLTSCERCGNCCDERVASGLSASSEDLKNWEDNNPNILKYTHKVHEALDCADLWFSPITGQELERCPWLRKDRNKPTYKCLIHDLKPEVCSSYPLNLNQMKIIGCPRKVI